MNNSIEIEIGGKIRGWKFNNLAYRAFLLKVMSKDYFAIAPYAMLYAGLYSYCCIKELPIDFTFEQVCEWADELSISNPDIIKNIDEIFTSSTQFSDLLGEMKKSNEVLNTDEEKKNISTGALVSQQDV